MIVADTGALLALIDADDRHHPAVRALFEKSRGTWMLPWAVLPEIDYLLLSQVGVRAERAFLADLAEQRFSVDWGAPKDLDRARELNEQYRALKLGLVDAVVIAVAERLRATAIVTFDLRHLGAILIRGQPMLWPRDA
jgi:predicted nucleic acid-binding protein